MLPIGLKITGIAFQATLCYPKQPKPGVHKITETRTTKLCTVSCTDPHYGSRICKPDSWLQVTVQLGGPATDQLDQGFSVVFLGSRANSEFVTNIHVSVFASPAPTPPPQPHHATQNTVTMPPPTPIHTKLSPPVAHLLPPTTHSQQSAYQHLTFFHYRQFILLPTCLYRNA
jgi:hypothetical protein